MNDCYSVDPAAFETSKELKFFVESFGHHTGRYLLTLPAEWRESVRKHLATAKPLEAKRINEIFAIGARRGALWQHPKLLTDFDAQSWIEQAAEVFRANPELVRQFVIRQQDLDKHISSSQMPTVSYDDFDISSNAAEEIDTTPEEYLRVSKMLLAASEEVVMVDPYLDPGDRSRASVLGRFLTQLDSTSIAKTVVVWVRESEVPARKQYERDLRDLLAELSLKHLRIQVVAVDDRRASDRLHARYLLSMRGAIQFDWGFIELNRSKRASVMPVPLAVHQNLIKKYVGRDNDLSIAWQLSLESCEC